MTTDQQRTAEFVMQVAKRIRIARQAKRLTQEEFSQHFGFNDRQTISTIETGVRPVSSEEMVKISKLLDRPISFFTDPYLVTEPNGFSYRSKGNSTDIDAFEQKTHKLISASRRFQNLLGQAPFNFSNQLNSLTRRATVVEAAKEGEQTCKALNLGVPPALNLIEQIEAQIKVHVLFVDAPESISAVACRLVDGAYILLNRKEASFRRNFNLGHELFHILTWKEMPPERIDTIQQGGGRPKPEKLADSFSSGLLIPTELLKECWQRRATVGNFYAQILAVAKEFRVSGEAIYWRLINTNFIKKENVPLDRSKLLRVDAAQERTPQDGTPREGKPNLYNAAFVKKLYEVLDHGLVSVRKAAEVLDCEPEDLRQLVASYNFEPSF
jgi:XRE family transcriptional regulator, fatty acid utilization regulator